MFTRIKTPQEINNIRISGEILETILVDSSRMINPGMSTLEVADIVARKLADYKDAKPVFLGYYGFPHVVCVSLNNQVIHGIPKRDTIIQDGDLVSLDFGVNYKGMITDSARTYVVGNTNKQKEHLLKVTDRSLMEGINVVKDSIRVGKISYTIEQILSKAKLGIVKEYVGHGVGHELHEEPNIPNYGHESEGSILRSGMTIAIEPMATLGSSKVYTENDGWTVSTSDNSLSAHFEDTILITDDGFEILTRSAE